MVRMKESCGRDGQGDRARGHGPLPLRGVRGGSRLRATRNDNYWKQDAEGRELPFADEVEVRIIPEAQAASTGWSGGAAHQLAQIWIEQ